MNEEQTWLTPKMGDTTEPETPLDTPDEVVERSMAERLEAFSRDLQNLINHHSIENLFDVPDFILADYIGSHLFTLAEMSRRRDEWFGFEPFPEEQFGRPTFAPSVSVNVEDKS